MYRLPLPLPARPACAPAVARRSTGPKPRPWPLPSRASRDTPALGRAAAHPPGPPRPELGGTVSAVAPASVTDPASSAPAPTARGPVVTTWLPISTPVPAPDRYAPSWVSGPASPPPAVPVTVAPVSRIEPPLPPPRPADRRPSPCAGRPGPRPAPRRRSPAPTGALALLPGEEVVMQLGALYLTNRRAILYAPTILRAAFFRDIDAVGSVTERSSGWMLLLGLLAVAMAALRPSRASPPGFEFKLGDLYRASPCCWPSPSPSSASCRWPAISSG